VRKGKGEEGNGRKEEKGKGGREPGLTFDQFSLRRQCYRQAANISCRPKEKDCDYVKVHRVFNRHA